MPKQKIIRAAAYARVSDPNKKDTPTIESQVAELRAYCEKQGYVLEERYVYEEAQSGYLVSYRDR